MRGVTRFCVYSFMLCVLVSFQAMRLQAASLTVGDSVYLGCYEQNDKSESREAIEWIVLEVQDEKALLISKLGLEYMKFDEDADSSWVSSTLRSWLNQEFYDSAFSDEEKEAILLTVVPNDPSQGNESWNPPVQSKTEDKFFLLSYQEIMKYYETEKVRKAKDTVYASSKGNAIRQVSNVAIKDVGWWTRSPGEDGKICFIETDGKAKSKKATERSTVRPVFWLDLSADSSNFSYSIYHHALSLMEKKKYKEAADTFETLEDYEDSNANCRECRYLQAEKASEAKEYETAIELYTNLNGYKDSDTLGRAMRYEYAVYMQDNSNYEKASQLFGEAGQYEDSMERMRNCFDEIGVPIYFISAEAVNAGLDNGYSKANPIKGDDRHFGWRLGRFFMSGFTRVIDGSGGEPVFVKTLGDSITLWFDLEQDIYRLNDNKNLSVSRDGNGYDEYFGVKKSNFGRGTLIIRHTDYQNAKSNPLIYTDHLLAKGTSGADTKVVINEEGDYEVALDYQLQDDDIFHINMKYGNYKILFRFSVRNGNCMVYPFDIETRAELQNTSITENGFYLDLARSR